MKVFLLFLFCFAHCFATPQGMVWVPPGEFTMGSNSPEAKRDEKPTHRVKVDGFWMDETPVTNKQFNEFVDATGYLTTAEIAKVIAFRPA